MAAMFAAIAGEALAGAPGGSRVIERSGARVDARVDARVGGGAGDAAGDRAGERIALPFICSMEGGRIRLMPSKERIHAILGQRQEQPVMSCAAGGHTDCQTMVAHRFTMACGGRRVQWADVAQAIGGRRNSRVWNEAGQLNLAITQGNAQPAAPCSAPGSAASGMQGMVQQIAARPCTADRPRETRFTMPSGFAPVAHFGGRILAATALDPRPTVDVVRESPQKVLIAAAPAATVNDTSSAMRRLLERTIISQPLPDIETAAPHTGSISAKSTTSAAGVTATAEAVPQLAWSATVRPALVEAFAASEISGTGGISTRDTMLWLALTFGLFSCGFVAWSRPVAFARITRFVPDKPRLSALAGSLAGRLSSVTRTAAGLASATSREDAATFPSDAIDAQLARVEIVVGLVDHELPLRRVLDEEILRVRQRLAVAKSAGAQGTVDRNRLPAAAYRVLSRDLERIWRIAESAKESISGAKPATVAFAKMPTTRAEAFDVLGINASVGEATIKKVADALRMSWHPDLAQDEADRAAREERIKQINVAMELIAGKRPSA